LPLLKLTTAEKLHLHQFHKLNFSSCCKSLFKLTVNFLAFAGEAAGLILLEAVFAFQGAPLDDLAVRQVDVDVCNTGDGTLFFIFKKMCAALRSKDRLFQFLRL